MDTRKTFEAIVGFVIVLFCLLFSVNVFKSGIKIKNTEYNKLLYAKFNNIDGIKVGSVVKIAGVNVGSVENIELDTGDFNVKLTMRLRSDTSIPADSVISVNSEGLLGGKYLGIETGIEETYLQNGEYFSSTQSTMNIEKLIGKVVASFTTK
ncbi:MAG: outer membrane lipid asymmetry maintenance protein MlaD [Rickettsiales bacterium]|nr:outer membrane lipid asymmetry maintenance protein MlaD [Rickettsiales bacterium]